MCAVGQRMPAWVLQACEDYTKRMPAECRLLIREVKAEPRSLGRSVSDMLSAEAVRLDAVTPKGARRVVLDERGARWSTMQLSEQMKAWLSDGRDVAFYIGGPDGLDAEFMARADDRLRVSDLTLPHAMVRVLLAEALYRAWTVVQGHPYHRS